MQPLVHPKGEPCESPSWGPEVRDIGRIVPVFVPASLVETGLETGTWTGPFSILPAGGVAIAWAVLVDGGIRFVLHELQREWEAGDIDWRTRSIQNLRALTSEPLGAGALFRDNGEIWLISLMDPDGLGTSRLLLTAEVARVFPNGYRVALPERNRAFAFSRELDAEEAATVENLIQRSYATSEWRLSPKIFEPDDLVITAV